MGVRPMHIETAQLLHGAARRYGSGSRRNRDFTPGVIDKWRGRSVTMASQFPPCAISRHGSGGIRHFTRQVYLAWERGRIVGTLAVGWCGTRLVTAELVDMEEPSPQCALCNLRAPAARKLAAFRVELLVVTA